MRRLDGLALGAPLHELDQLARGGIDRRERPLMQAFPSGMTQSRPPCAPTSSCTSPARGHPLMVIVEIGLKSEGLLERGNDW